METTKIAVKVHKRENEVLLAACDKSLLGKVLGDEGFEITIKEDFYFEELVEREDFLKLLAESTSANLIGKTTVNTCVEAQYVEKDAIRNICGVPHVQIYSI